MATVVTGLFNAPVRAREAISALELRGVPDGDISLVAAEHFKAESFGIEHHSKVAEGAAIGAGAGGAIGALIAGLTLVGAIGSGGLGLVAAGPIIAALAGAGAGAATGGAVGTAIGLAIPEDEVKFYENAFKKGAVLVGVQCENDQTRKLVEDVLKAHKADKISRA